MQRGPRSGFFYALSCLPVLGAGIVGPDIFHASEEVKKAVFAICVVLALTCLVVGHVKEKRGEAADIRPGHRRRMIALYGMVACGFGFVGFAAAYWWPASSPDTARAESVKIGTTSTKEQTSTAIPYGNAATLSSPPIGSLRFVSSNMTIQVKISTHEIAGRIEVILFNDSDKLIKAHVITAGNINGIPFAYDKIAFDSIAYPHQEFSIISNRITGIVIKPQEKIQDTTLFGWFEYDIYYGFAEEKTPPRHTGRKIEISYWVPFPDAPAGTETKIPIQVVSHDIIEE